MAVRKLDGLNSREEAAFRAMESPIESILMQSDIERLLRKELVLQLESDQGAQENGTATNQWPKLKPEYAAWKKSAKRVRRFGSRRPKDLILVLTGKLYDSLKRAGVFMVGNTIVVEWADKVRSEDGFDYPSYWQGQNGALSKHHAGFRKFVINKRLLASVATLVQQGLQRKIDGMGIR